MLTLKEGRFPRQALELWWGLSEDGQLPSGVVSKSFDLSGPPSIITIVLIIIIVVVVIIIIIISISTSIIIVITITIMFVL